MLNSVKKFPPSSKLKVFMVGLLLAQVMFLLLGTGISRAEGFSDSAFQNQWNQTDQAVATGKVSRTYFWGPQPFAHTSEVYAESPTNGQREVQYFDKARMELTKKPGQSPDLVTNGLLTEELVTGKMQVGDSQFLQRSPATNPVAGDQLGNNLTPTYASFNEGKLAFGVEGATPSPDRTGQTINEAVNTDGHVSTIDAPVAQLKYARYFSETGHNVADVFNNFFQADPLGESKWLSVMGYPITEAFWARSGVVVGGKSVDVLIQLFQRRALTYTPSNPAGYQVEMGNIGQHYYVWRYGFDTRDQLPGNYRLINSQGQNLYSTNIHKPSDRVKLTDAPSIIKGYWALNEGRAVVWSGQKIYLADLTKPRAMAELSLAGYNVDLGSLEVVKAVSSISGNFVAVVVHSSAKPAYVVHIFEVDTLVGDNLNVISSHQGFTSESYLDLSFSNNRDLLALSTYENLSIIDARHSENKQTVALSGKAYWVGTSDNLLVTTPRTTQQDTSTGKITVTPGKVTLVDVSNIYQNKPPLLNVLVSGPNVQQAVPSPDGFYFAFNQDKDSTDRNALNVAELTFRSLADPTKDLTAAFEMNLHDDYNFPKVEGWSPDGTFVRFRGTIPGHAGTGGTRYEAVSLVNGKTLDTQSLYNGYSNVVSNLSAAGGVYVLYNANSADFSGPKGVYNQTITIWNFDNSEKTVLFTDKPGTGLDFAEVAVKYASVVQVPVVK